MLTILKSIFVHCNVQLEPCQRTYDMKMHTSLLKYSVLLGVAIRPIYIRDVKYTLQKTNGK